jgi:hypothetical protein
MRKSMRPMSGRASPEWSRPLAEPHRKQPQDRAWLPWLLGAVAIAIIIAAGMVVAHAQSEGCNNSQIHAGCYTENSCWGRIYGPGTGKNGRCTIPVQRCRCDQKTIVIIVKP